MKKTSKKSKSQKGFTLVEVMISIGLFTIIMVIGIGAILGVNVTNRKTQSMRAIIDNMSFVMEDMARSMRLGDYFVCKESEFESITLLDVGSPQTTRDGENCKSISFEPYWNFLSTDSSNQIVYYISNGAIWKKEFNNPVFDVIPITPEEINIDSEKSGFTVIGSDRTDGLQPKIRIVLAGTINLSGVSTDFNLQTTVSQRVLDVLSLPTP
jgi:prepilin-type N-terminal cleavage/methylation domain-containing protein